MSLGRDFKLAFLLSAMLHFLVGVSFSIVLAPINKTELPSSISFYGNLFRERTDKKERRDFLLSPLTLRKQMKIFAKNEGETITTKRFLAKEALYLSTDKDSAVALRMDKPHPDFLKREIPSLLRGKEREEPEAVILDDSLIFQSAPPLLSYISKGEIFNVGMRILISPQGVISFVEPEISSGNPEVDLIAMKTIREWFLLSEAQNWKWTRVSLHLGGE